MAIEIFMPKAGMAMEEGRIIRWLKEIGDPVELDEPIMEIETDKVSMEAEAPGTGVLLAKLYPDDTTVPVLTTIGYIGGEGEALPASAAKEADPGKKATPAPAAAAGGAAPLGEHAAQPLAAGELAATPYARALAHTNNVSLAEVTPTGKAGEITGVDVEAAVKASSLARAVAADKGVDLARVQGTGYGGKVMKADVLAAVDNTSASVGGTPVKMSRMRKVIGERMLQSHLEVPPVTQNIKTNVNALLAFREQVNQGREPKISVNDMVIKAAAMAAREYGSVRGILRNGALITRENVDIGFAVGMEEGLLVPVIRAADCLSLSEIARQAKGLAAKARSGGLRAEDCGDGTLTISNMGMFGVTSFTPIINQPESIILGVCAIQEELAMVDGTVVVNKTMNLSLTFDHRILDGVGAAKFQLRVKELLENPMKAFV